MNFLNKIKQKYEIVVPINQLPYCIYKNAVITFILLLISFLLVITSFFLNLDASFLLVGIPLIFILLISFCMWLSDYLFGRIFTLEGTIKEFSNTKKNHQNFLQRKFVNHIIRSTYTLLLDNGKELKVVCSNKQKLKIGSRVKLYYTEPHLLLLDDNSYFLNQVSFTELLKNHR